MRPMCRSTSMRHTTCRSRNPSRAMGVTARRTFPGASFRSRRARTAFRNMSAPHSSLRRTTPMPWSLERQRSERRRSSSRSYSWSRGWWPYPASFSGLGPRTFSFPLNSKARYGRWRSPSSASHCCENIEMSMAIQPQTLQSLPMATR